MTLPTLQAQYPQHSHLIYAAADTIYFDRYARPLIVSVETNTPHLGIHLHIYDPTPQQLQWCESRKNLTVSWENVNYKFLKKVALRWHNKTDLSNRRQVEMQKKSQTMSPGDFLKLVHNTYYACARFVRLNQILNTSTTTCLSLDVDGLVRKNFNMELPAADIHLYEKPKDGSHLAGALLFQPHSGSKNFLKAYADQLEKSLLEGNIYWFLDQVVLDQLIPQYHKGLLPMSYIDWAMRPDSAIWSAKGRRKELAIFTEELKKYQS